MKKSTGQLALLLVLLGQSLPQTILAQDAIHRSFAPLELRPIDDGIDMVTIPGGSFYMGSEVNADERPRHMVYITSFLMGRTEVTQKQWMDVMGSNPSRFSTCGPDCPVESVSWNDVQQFIEKLNQKTGQKYRLPSEAEWEYAARAGSTTEWSFGNSEAALGNYAWYKKNSGQQTHPVGQKLPNAFGLFDMHGNVFEWTQDCWHFTYTGAPTDGSAWTAGCKGDFRVLRGGSWIDSDVYFRSAYRFVDSPVNRDGSTNGFRLARYLLNAEVQQTDDQRKRILKAADVQTNAGDTTTNLVSKISDKYAASIQAVIRPNITFDADSVSGNPAVEVQVGLKPDGTIVYSQIVKSSGVKSWDTAATRALDKTERLPKDENDRVPPVMLITMRPRER